MISMTISLGRARLSARIGPAARRTVLSRALPEDIGAADLRYRLRALIGAERPDPLRLVAS